ncbi:MAG: GNAT family N-acetyltransferase [Patescibacteria group bacterium]
MKLRLANSGDLKAVKEIAGLLYIDMPDFVWDTEEFIKKQIKRGEYYIGEENGKTAGMVSLRERNGMLYIETLAVVKDAQSSGIGSKLVEFAKKFAKDKGFKILRTTSFYEYGVKDFYIKQGFRLLDEPGEYNGHKFYRLEFKLSTV